MSECKIGIIVDKSRATKSLPNEILLPSRLKDRDEEEKRRKGRKKKFRDPKPNLETISRNGCPGLLFCKRDTGQKGGILYEKLERDDI